MWLHTLQVPMRKFCQCGALENANGSCGACGKGYRSEVRQTTKERGYGSDWERLSEAFRQEHPLCMDCEKQGKVEPSEELHHVVPIRVRPDLRLERSNLVALCNSCHQKRHGRGSPPQGQ